MSAAKPMSLIRRLEAYGKDLFASRDELTPVQRQRYDKKNRRCAAQLERKVTR